MLLSASGLLAACLSLCDPAGAARGEEALAVDLAPGGERLVEGLRSGSVVLREVRGERSWPLEPAFTAPCWAAAFDGTGDRVAVLDHRNHLMVWTLGDGEPVKAWSDVVVDEVTEEEPFSLCFPGGVCLEWSPGGEFLAAQVHYGLCAVWTRDGRRLRSWHSAERTEDLAWRGTQLLMPQGNTVTVWSVKLEAVEAVRTLELDEEMTAFAASPDGDVYWTGHEGGRLCRRDSVSGAVQAEHRLPDSFAVWDGEDDCVASIALSPSGKRVAYSLAPSVHVRVLDAESLRLRQDSGFLTAHFGETMPVTWSPDGEVVLAAFPCSRAPLRAFSEAEPTGREVLQEATPPRFRGALGVVLVSGRPVLLGPGGDPVR